MTKSPPPAPLTAEMLEAFRLYYSEECSNAAFDIRTLLAHIAHQSAEIARLEALRPIVTVNGDGEATEVTFAGETMWKVSKPTAPWLRRALAIARELHTPEQTAEYERRQALTIKDMRP